MAPLLYAALKTTIEATDWALRVWLSLDVSDGV